MAQKLLAAAGRRALAAQPAGLSDLLSAASGRLVDIAAQRQSAAQLHSSPWQREGEPPGPDRKLDRKTLENRLLYRSRQRGFLELDLLIGMWAERELPRMPEGVMRDLEAVLEQENPDMFKWLTGQAQPPPDMAANRAFQALRAHVETLTDKHHSVPRSAGEAPKEWVRGWTDSGKELAGSSGTGSSSSESSGGSSSGGAGGKQ